ncbi:hypothetical protein CCACVL1_27740 [Corchorus capsularis]|uniref:Uncharacterized protein n=1 Tax=Corchorus capsularis TaxID=210143 RepID=A0A1R3G903_COCAP|nr:hypothetical protein CCACVL1_27740 [Corchorus capsularis]
MAGSRCKRQTDFFQGSATT